jgi:hypothetical protein
MERRFGGVERGGMTGGGGRAPGVGVGWWLRAAAAVLVRPGLWPTAVGQAVRLARPGWWKRAPFLPVPDGEYVRFRLQTAYGSHGTPAAGDLVAYLNWCREFKG